MTDFSNGLSRIINSGKVNNQSEIIKIDPIFILFVSIGET